MSCPAASIASVTNSPFDEPLATGATAGLLANANRADNIALARRLLGAPDPAPTSAESDGADGGQQQDEWNTCPCCGGRMVIVETFEPGCQPRLWPIPSIGLDSS